MMRGRPVSRLRVKLFAWRLAKIFQGKDRRMPRYLNVSNKLLSIRGRMSITDESGNPVYDAMGEFVIFVPAWRIMKDGREVASIRRVILAWPWRPTWEVGCEFGRFRIAKTFLSFTDDYEVIGGLYDGAEVTGRLIKRDFSISHRGRVIARASGALVSMRDQYSVELVDDDKQTELFTVSAMVAHHMAHHPGTGISLIGD